LVGTLVSLTALLSWLGIHPGGSESTGSHQTPTPVVTSDTAPEFTAEPPPSVSVGPFARLLTTGPRSGQSGGLTLTVERIDGHETEIDIVLKAMNTTGDSLTLPVFGDFFLIDDTGRSYPTNPNGADWPGSVPPGATVTGTIVVTQPLASHVRTLRAGFSHVYGSFSIASITVTGIAVAGG
jgi:hypothetical protein